MRCETSPCIIELFDKRRQQILIGTMIATVFIDKIPRSNVHLVVMCHNFAFVQLKKKKLAIN